MLFDISDLDPRGVGLDQTIELEPFEWEGGDLVRTDPIRLIGRIKPTRRGLELVARYETVAHLPCARCLKALDRPLGGEFRLFLQPPVEDGESPFETIPDDDPDAVDLYPLEGQAVDLAAVLREQVDLALPVRVLCREECRGLCAGCGVALDTDACRCTEPTADPRFGALREFKAVLEQRKGGKPS